MRYILKISLVLGVLFNITCGTAVASSINWGVPYISQKTYDSNMKESACGPTSVAMLLQFYFPNSGIDMPEVYHSGTQTYIYNSGPAMAYRNVSFASGDTGLTIIDEDYRDYYSGTYSGMTLSYMQNYLSNIWDIDTTIIDEDGVYDAINKGPILGHVYAHGNTNWGHYVVIRGIDQAETPDDRTDDTIYINDPYDVWNSSWDTGGENKEITYHQFFDPIEGDGTRYGAAWFRDALSLSPNDNRNERKYTVIVDTGNNNYEGNSITNSFNLDDHEAQQNEEYIWKLYYGSGGDWFYPTIANRAARWTPHLSKSGLYQVVAKYRSDSGSGSVKYTIFNSADEPLVSKTIDQSSDIPAWNDSVISKSIKLENGCYVRASDISANTNIDSIKFKYIPNSLIPIISLLLLSNDDSVVPTPTLVAPANGSTLNTLSPLYEYNSNVASDATTLRLQVSEDPGFTTSVQSLWSSPGSSSFRFPRNLEPATTYYWRTWFMFDDTEGPYSEVWSFTTGSGGIILPAPDLTAPADGSVKSIPVFLQWDSVNSTVQYLLKWRVAGEGRYSYLWVDETEIVLSWLDSESVYEWWVSAMNDYAIGIDSETWQFTTTSSSATDIQHQKLPGGLIKSIVNERGEYYNVIHSK